MKNAVSRFGKFLSGMVMPNIGAFIAWGFLTALFIEAGWFPNEKLASMVSPMLTYLLPILIAGQGGKMIAGDRGRVIAAIAVVGCICGSDYTMLMGAMVMGPLAGWVIKQFDKKVEGHIPAGFEMLVNNFSVGILGMLLAILGYYVIGPFMTAILTVLTAGVDFLVAHSLLPLVSIFIEPAKVLFLNNAINHGIFSPIGASQAAETGRSIMYMLEANPGPGLGVLLAYCFFCKDDTTRQSAPGAVIIHLLGGIHEIYFPYILMNPVIIIAPIVGNFCAILFYSMTGAGLSGPASPGSIIAYMAMAPRDSILTVLLGVVIAGAVSFVLSSVILKATSGHTKSLTDAQNEMKEMKAQAKGEIPEPTAVNVGQIRKIVFACDAGMGSSAMGAGVLRKKVQDAGLSQISVTNSAINNLPPDVDLVITHRDLTERAMRQVPQAQHISLTNFLDSGLYSNLTERLVAAQRHNVNEEKVRDHLKDSFEEGDTHLFKLGAENIFLGRKAANKEEAIRFAGEQLVKGGYVEPEYVEAMLDREKLTPTYLGESIAVPHGTVEAKDRVLKTGVVFCQYPEGVRFGEEEDDIARLVIGIAARNNEHIQVITSLTNALDDESVIERLAHTTSVDEVLELLAGRK